jgi:hypothetical protein
MSVADPRGAPVANDSVTLLPEEEDMTGLEL